MQSPRLLTGHRQPWHSSVAVLPDVYDSLSPASRLVAQACGVVAPFGLNIAKGHQMLATARVTLDGRRIEQLKIRECYAELLAAGVVEKRGRHDHYAVSSLVLPLTRTAFEAGHLGSLANAFQKVGLSGWYDPAEDQMLLRNSVVAGNTVGIEEALDGPGLVPDWSFLAEPFAEDLLLGLSEPLRRRALDGCLAHVIDTAAPPDPIIDASLRLAVSPFDHIADIAFVQVLRGRFDAALDVFAALPQDAREVRSGEASTRALIALLQGRDDEALRGIEDALAAEKAGTRKRMVAPKSRAFVLALLAMVREDTPTTTSTLTQVLRVAARADVSEQLLEFVANAANIKARGGVFTRRPDHPCFDALLDGLLSCWLGDFNPGPEKRRDVLLGFRDRALAHGFDWLTAECNEVLRRYAALHEGNEGEDQPPSGEHAQLGTLTLASLGAPMPEWEYPLRDLERLAQAAVGRAKTAKRETETAKRLAWRLEVEGHAIRVGPREQKQKKNGDWTIGRRVALRRLVEDAAKLDYLLPEDRNAIAAISTRQYYGGMQEFYAGGPTLHALAGHPLVFNSAGRQVDVVERQPELVVDEGSGDNMVVQMRPSPQFGNHYHTEMVGQRRCEVTRFLPAHIHLLDVVTNDGLVLPKAAKPRLLEAVASLASDIRVQSATADGASGRELDADSEPWVQLEPWEGGLSVALVVEPIAGSDICFEPGAGGSVVFAHQDGERVQARRDLDAEQRAVARLVAACPALAERPTEQVPLLLPDPVQCLELLERLDAVEARCRWPKGERFRIVPSTPSFSLTVRSAEQWLQASGQLAVDEDRVLDLKRLFELLEASPKSRFLELGSGEFLALTSTFRRQLDDLAGLSAPAAKGEVRMHRLAALALDDLLEDAALDADHSLREMRERLRAAESFEPTVPSTLQAELRPYQVEGFAWLARLSRWGAGACLADDMGLGKTVQTLAVLLDRAPEGPAVVVAPTSVMANWIDEARRFAPTLNVTVYAGAASSRADLLADAAPFDLFVTTYGVLQNDIEELATVPWHTAVLDEAQAIKNPQAKRSRAAHRLPGAFRVITTGTPIQNNLQDLYSLFNFANPGLLGSQDQFRRNFALPIERDQDADAQSRLRRLIAPFMLRRLKATVLDDLPERTEITLHVTMSEEEASLYEALRRKAVEELEAARLETPELAEGARRVQVLAHLTKLRQACCNPRLVMDGHAPESSKLATFAATLEELRAGHHKVLVFSQFVRHLRLVEEHLRSAGIAYQYLDGATPAKTRAKRIAAFQAGEGEVFLISLKAGGVGLNLTAADYVIHMDPWWNPAVEDQASDRAHRIGQTRPVTIYRLVTEGTIEEQIVELHHRKRDLAEQLLEGADAAGRLDAEELLELLRQPLDA